MKVISFNRIRELKISPLDCYSWVDDAIRDKSSAILPPKIGMHPGEEGVFYNTMPSVICNKGLAGVKMVTRYPSREPSLDSTILLYDLMTGENIAILDGNWITAMRTGAVAAHSINLFAVKSFSTIGFIGLGNTSRATLEVLVDIFPDRCMNVKLLKYKNQHILFKERFSKERDDRYKNLTFTYVEDYRELVCGSDVVVSATTYFGNNICDDDCFKEGVLLVPIHTRGFGNCDLFFDKIYGDDRGHIQGFKYFDKFKSFAEVAEVLNGYKPGRESEAERIIAYNVGISLHDIYFAGKIYEMCKGDEPEIHLETPKDKFWI